MSVEDPLRIYIRNLLCRHAAYTHLDQRCIFPCPCSSTGMVKRRAFIDRSKVRVSVKLNNGQSGKHFRGSPERSYAYSMVTTYNHRETVPGKDACNSFVNRLSKFNGIRPGDDGRESEYSFPESLRPGLCIIKLQGW